MNIEVLYQLDPAPAVQRLLCCSALDLVMEALSKAGEGWGLALMAIAIAWQANRAPRDVLRSALRGLAILAATGALVAVTKRIVRAPRPLQLLGSEQVRVLLEPLRLMSFPSGHSAAAAALALWASREPSRGTRVWPWLFALLCGLSRVYAGAHWVTDVVAGWVLGVAVALAIGRAWPRARGASAGLAVAGPGPVEAPVPAAASEGDPCR